MVTLDQHESFGLQSEWGSCAQYAWAAVETVVAGTAAAVVCIVASSVVAFAVDTAVVSVVVVVAGTSAAVAVDYFPLNLHSSQYEWV